MAPFRRRVNRVLNAPAESEVWELFGDEAELGTAYWNEVRLWNVDARDVERAAQELLVHSRAWSAAGLLAIKLRDAASVNCLP